MDEHGLGATLQLASKVGDPGLVFTLYFPLVAALSWVSGVRLIGSAIACEWTNLILKWSERV